VVSIPPGDVQRMSAGTGVQHSEFNHAPSEVTHFLQIWIKPNRLGVQPSYEQKRIEPSLKNGQLLAIASDQPLPSAVKIHADATLYAGVFNAGQHAELTLDPQRCAYVHLVTGELSVNGHSLNAGDAMLMKSEASLSVDQGKDAEVLVFDLAAN
jgi:redox-sensitive bicupin YhaK (pirin superfamily)